MSLPAMIFRHIFVVTKVTEDVQNQLNAILNAELVIESPQMGAHRGNGNIQFTSDLLVAQAVEKITGNLGLARR